MIEELFKAEEGIRSCAAGLAALGAAIIPCKALLIGNIIIAEITGTLALSLIRTRNFVSVLKALLGQGIGRTAVLLAGKEVRRIRVGLILLTGDLVFTDLRQFSQQQVIAADIFDASYLAPPILDVIKGLIDACLLYTSPSPRDCS